MKKLIILSIFALSFSSCKKDWINYECGCYNSDFSAEPVLVGETWEKKFENEAAMEIYEEKQSKKVLDKELASRVECKEL